MGPIGAALGYLCGGYMAHHFGWRSAFFVAGGPGFVLAIACLFIVEPTRRLREKADVLGSIKSLASYPVYVQGVLGYCAYTFAVGGFAHWAPTFLVRRFGTELAKADFQFGVCTLVGGTIGTWIGGTWADRALKARANRIAAAKGNLDGEVAVAPDSDVALVNLWICCISAAIGAPLAAMAFFAPTRELFFAAVFPCEIALFVSTSPVNAVILRGVPSELRASAMALSIFAIHILGDFWSPPAIGFLAGRTSISQAMLAMPVAVALAAVFWFPGKAARNAAA
jgi:hypothetical protein